MRKYYLPTSSLNFNNILSTESVSPKAFYECRGFGYRRWTSIPENACDFAMTLYDRPMVFSRPASELEDHPLLIEIASDEVLLPVGDGIYACDHTLYFNPTTVRFIFFSEQDKRVALSLTESSLETKLVGVYRSRICVESFEASYVPSAIHKFDEINGEAVARDQRINRMKGLLYGYYVGASLSTKPEQVRRFGIYQEIQNIFAAIVSSLTRVPTEGQQERLDKLLGLLNEVEPFYQEIVEFAGGTDRARQLLSLLRKFGMNPPLIDGTKMVSSLTSGLPNESYGIRWIKSQIDNLQIEMKQSRSYLSPERDEIVVVDEKLQKISDQLLPDPMMQKLFSAWVNEILVKREFSGKISVCKEELVTALTFKAKEVLGESWTDDSPIRRYLNALRRHIIGKEKFDEPISDDLLSAVTMVLSKGDDWETFLRFMQSKGITDYRLAFAMYGELNGFANLTRDFTDVILGGRNGCRRAVYQEFHGQLLGQKIDWQVLDEQNVESSTVTVPPSHLPSEPLKTVSSTETLKTRVLRFFDGDDFKCKMSPEKRKSLRDILLNVFEQLGDNPDPNCFVSVLGERKDGWSRDNKPWNLVKEEFAPDFKPARKCGKRATQKKKVLSSPCLPGLQEQGSVLSYHDWLEDVRQLIDSTEAADCFSGDVVFFVDKWELHPKPQYESKVVDKSNAAVIGRLRKFLEMQCHTTHPNQVDWKPKLYAQIPIEQIIERLKARYGC